jgi:hypothetical protein
MVPGENAVSAAGQIITAGAGRPASGASATVSVGSLTSVSRTISSFDGVTRSAASLVFKGILPAGQIGTPSACAQAVQTSPKHPAITTTASPVLRLISVPFFPTAVPHRNPLADYGKQCTQTGSATQSRSELTSGLAHCPTNIV